MSEATCPCCGGPIDPKKLSSGTVTLSVESVKAIAKQIMSTPLPGLESIATSIDHDCYDLAGNLIRATKPVEPQPDVTLEG